MRLPRTRTLAAIAGASVLVPSVLSWMAARPDPATGELLVLAPGYVVRASAALSVLGFGIAAACLWIVLVRFASKGSLAGECVDSRCA